MSKTMDYITCLLCQCKDQALKSTVDERNKTPSHLQLLVRNVGQYSERLTDFVLSLHRHAQTHGHLAGKAEAGNVCWSTFYLSITLDLNFSSTRHDLFSEMELNEI